MDKIEKIGREIKGLSPSELAALRQWFRDFDAAADESKLGRVGNEGTDSPEANATETDASDKLFRS